MTYSKTLGYIIFLNGSSLKQVLLEQIGALLNSFYKKNALVSYINVLVTVLKLLGVLTIKFSLNIIESF